MLDREPSWITRVAAALCVLAAAALADEYDDLIERLRKESPGEAEKVRLLPRDEGLRFLRERFGAAEAPKGAKEPAKPGGKPPKAAAKLPARTERFERIDTLEVGDFSLDLCRREDGAFGVGEIRRGRAPLRRADFLLTWSAGGHVPAFASRDGLVVKLRDPDVTLSFSAETRTCAGTRFDGFGVEVRAEQGPVVETASWEPGGRTHGLSYWDGYRGWHAPPDWQPAAAVPETSPKLQPSLLAGTGFQMLHGRDGALVLSHTAPGDRLTSASRGDTLELRTEWFGPTTVRRTVLWTSGDTRTNLWTRAFDVTHDDLRRAFDLPRRDREIVCLWPPFGRRGFRETAAYCAEATAREGFTAAAIDVIWDNLEFHGGAKNMNVWSLEVCEGYGGPDGLRALVEECRRHGLKVIPWVPTAHLSDKSPVWKEHPDWVLGDTPSATKGSGPIYGSLHGGFRDYFRGRILGVLSDYGFDGFWMDSHLPVPGRPPDNPQGQRLAALYAEFIRAGARQLIVEGDASAFGSYGIGFDGSWSPVPSPDLFYGSAMLGWSHDPELYRRHFRAYVAAGAAWVVSLEFLASGKIEGAAEARREVREVIADYRKVKDRMVHRFAHEDGSGYTWTNDRDATKVVWLLNDANLPDGRRGKAGKVYVLP